MLALITLLAADFDLKQILLTVFVLVVLGMAAWFVSAKAKIPEPFNWFIYLVLVVVGVLVVYRFFQGL